MVTSRIYPLPAVEVKGLRSSTTTHDGGVAEGRASVEQEEEGVHLGAWGYQVSAVWGVGHVKGSAEVYELGTCWVDGFE